MQEPTTAEITLRISVRFDADTWGDDLREVAADLLLRLVNSNDYHAPEAVEVLHTQTLHAEEVTR